MFSRVIQQLADMYEHAENNVEELHEQKDKVLPNYYYIILLYYWMWIESLTCFCVMCNSIVVYMCINECINLTQSDRNTLIMRLYISTLCVVTHAVFMYVMFEHRWTSSKLFNQAVCGLQYTH
jgi:hypothetical protein